MYYEDSYYFVYTDFPEDVVYRAHKLSDRQLLEMIFEGDSFGELILEHQRSSRACALVPRWNHNERRNSSMPRVQESDEVRILRFFEEEPLEKAELLFRIVENKMRKRMPPGRSVSKKKDIRIPRHPVEGAREEVRNP
jgi:hypothetical protein